MGQRYLTDSESLSFNIEATCLLLSPPRNFLYEIKTDKYRPYPSMISMFTSDSQHPPRSRHVVHLGDVCLVRSLKSDQLEILLSVYTSIVFLSRTIISKHRATDSSGYSLCLPKHPCIGQRFKELLHGLTQVSCNIYHLFPKQHKSFYSNFVVHSTDN